MLGILCVNASSPLPPHLVSFEYEHSRDINTSLTAVFYHWNTLFVLLFAVGYAQYSLKLGPTMLMACSVFVVCCVGSLMLLPACYGSRTILARDEVPFKSEYDTVQQGADYSDEKTALKINYNSIQPSEGSAIVRRPVAKSSASSEASEGDDESVATALMALGSCESTDSELGGYSGGKGGAEQHECFYGAGLTIREAIFTWRYWAVFLVFLVICGSGLLVIYNVSDIAESAGGQASPFYVTIFALGNGLGKVMAGMASDWAVKHNYCSSLQLLALNSFAMCVVHLLLATGYRDVMFQCFFWVGFANGCAVSLISIITTDIFGYRHIATTLAVIDNAPLCGSFFFSTTLIAIFYHNNAVDPVSGVPTCLGAECFRDPLLICATCCFATAMLSVYMHVKTPQVK